MNILTIVKIGGKIVEDPDSLDAFLKDFSIIAGNKILVHGGGRSASKLAERLGIESKMVDGRRITDEQTLAIVTMVYGGLINKNIIAKLQALKINALGLTGADMNIILAEKRPVKTIDYGYVGDIKMINASAFKELLNQDLVPVLAPLTHDGNGNILNTNADTIAAEVAKGLAYDYYIRLIYCFEKKGVLKDENNEDSVIQVLDPELYRKYKEEGIITGGMIPKLDNAFETLSFGVKEVVITKASEINKGKGTFITLKG